MTRPPDMKKTAEGLQPHDGRGNQQATDCIAQDNGSVRHNARGRTGHKKPMPGPVLLEEVLFLLPDRSPHDIAATLGYAGPTSISRAMYRLGEQELGRRFARVQRRTVSP